MNTTATARQGFTLIELSIVLVIIGLIVGGVLVGQDLIRAAEVRATISQIEKYNTAVNTFRGKYGGLPGDMNAAAATQFGFVSRGQYAGEGDGNGIIEGVGSDGEGNNCGVYILSGETGLFWVDLSAAHLIDGSFTTASATAAPTVSQENLASYFPEAKLGNGNYVYVWSGGISPNVGGGGPNVTCATSGNGTNYFGIAALVQAGGVTLTNAPGVTVQQAYQIDSKVDDGLPQSGRVSATYINFNAVWMGPAWAQGGGVNGANDGGVGNGGGGGGGSPTTNSTTGWAASCYDNRGGSGPQQYSVEFSNGANVNCSLSFQFQ